MQIEDAGAAERDAWSAGFERISDGQLVCQVCAALLRGSQADAETHRVWHRAAGH